MFKALYTHFKPPKLKYLVKFYTYYFEMPANYQKSVYLANASFCDNVNWYYYRGIEIAFDSFIERIKQLSPSTKDEDVLRNVMNKISVMEFCSHVMEVNFPLMKDSGQVEMIKGFCAKHGFHYNTHLGGLILSENIVKSQMKALAILSSFRHICAEVPFAGSHTGLKINPSNYSEKEIERLAQSFTKIMFEKNFFGPHVNIFEPDMSCSDYMINTIVEQFLKIKNSTNSKDLACITGKNISKGGLQCFEDCLSDGIFYGIKRFLNDDLILYKLKIDGGLKNKTFMIKSLDKIGINLATRLNKEEAKCVGISEPDFSIFKEDGINIEEALKYKQKHGSCRNYFPPYNDNKFLTEKCDILILTNNTEKLDYSNSPNVEARIIVEAANGVITPTAHKILSAKNKLVLPDIYINSGSSVASYVEYVKNVNSEMGFRTATNNLYFVPRHFPRTNTYEKEKNTETITYNPDLEEENSDRDFIKPALEIKMNSTGNKLIKIIRDYNLDLDIRTAAYILASEKIFDLLQKSKCWT